MRIRTVLFLIFIAQSAFATMNAAERAVVWTTVWTEARDHFIGFDSAEAQYNEWKSCFDPVLQSLLSQPDDVEFWRALRIQVASLGDGRTEIVIPRDLPQKYDTVPIRCMMSGDRVLVERLSSSPQVQSSKIRVGDELLRIDGIPVMQILSQDCVPHVSGDNREARLAKAVWRVFTGPPGTSAKLEFQKPDGTEYSAELDRDSGMNNRYYAELFSNDSAGVRLIGKRILYADFGSSLDRQNQYFVLDHLKENPRIDAIIFDLRETRSGAVLPDLIAKLEPFTVPMGPYKEIALNAERQHPLDENLEFVRTWREIAEDWIWPDENSFRGRIIALVSPLTSGAAEQFLQPLIFANRILLIGQPTAGSAGQTVQIPLMGGGSLELTVRRPDWEGDTGMGKGFGPYMQVLPTAVGLERGEDEILSAALRELGFTAR